jgi:hypothetical protein
VVVGRLKSGGSVSVAVGESLWGRGSCVTYRAGGVLWLLPVGVGGSGVAMVIVVGP